MTVFFIRIIACVVAVAFARQTYAQNLPDAQVKFFESKIRPVLMKHCYECHSAASGKSKGGLKVDSREALLRGGDTGPGVVSRSLDKSLLYEAITYEGDYQMPPKGKLPDEVIADFRKWILVGATDPRVVKINEDVQTEIDIEKGREFWAYRPPVHHDPPEHKDSDWPRTSIDQFVLAKLNDKGLKPVDDASAQALVRRLYFVIIGLPPTAEDASKWVMRLTGEPTALAAGNEFGEPPGVNQRLRFHQPPGASPRLLIL